MNIKSLFSIIILLFVSLQSFAQAPTTAHPEPKAKPELIYSCNKNEPKLRLMIINKTDYIVCSTDASKNTIDVKMNFKREDMKSITVLERSKDASWRKIASKFPVIEPNLAQILLITTK